MARHTTFRYCLDPTVEQVNALEHHVGASRFAYSQCLRMVFDARRLKESGASVKIPRTGYDLINRFNRWKTSEDAGRVFAVDSVGVVAVKEVGLVWRREVFQQVFEEAAVDLGRGLAAWSESRRGERAGPAIATRISRRSRRPGRRSASAISSPRAGSLRSVSVTNVHAPYASLASE